MKINKILSICLSMALLSSGCSDDLGLQPDNNPVAGEGQTVRIAASMGDKDSRLAYNETDTEVTLAWEEGDVLKVLNPIRDTLITNFTLVEGAGTIAGQFEGTPMNAYHPGDKLYALYHNTLLDSHLDEDGNVTLMLKEQNGQLNPDFQIMYGDAVYEGNGAIPGMTLNNIVSILKITIPTDKTLTRVELDNHQFRSKATLVLQNSPSDAYYQTFESGDLVYSYNKFDEGDNGIVAYGPFEPVDGEVTVYFYVLSVKKYWSEDGGYSETYTSPSFVAYDEDNQIYVSAQKFDSKFLEKGRMYELRSEIFSIVNFENEAEADGSENRPYEIANSNQLYSFMLRCKKGLTDKNGNFYEALHYQLTSDIALDGAASWEAFSFFGSFNGQGYTVSGVMHDSFFNGLYNAEVSNLVLDFNYESLEPYRKTYSRFASLAYFAENSTILNCQNRSNICISAENLGGLVADLYGSTKMIGCVNHGNIENHCYEGYQHVGGLVAYMYGGPMIEACYNTGHLSIHNATMYYPQYFGGLVGIISDGYADDVKNGLVNACWTSGTFSINNWSDSWYVGNLIGKGYAYNCYWTENVPTTEELQAMNAAMTNTYFEFDTVTGTLVAKKPAVSLPEFDIEDF